MTAAQIAKFYRDKGFAAETGAGFVYVSLNRRVSTMEVDAAMDFEAPIVGRYGGKVMLLGA